MGEHKRRASDNDGEHLIIRPKMTIAELAAKACRDFGPDARTFAEWHARYASIGLSFIARHELRDEAREARQPALPFVADPVGEPRPIGQPKTIKEAASMMLLESFLTSSVKAHVWVALLHVLDPEDAAVALCKVAHAEGCVSAATQRFQHYRELAAAMVAHLDGAEPAEPAPS